MLSNYCLKKKVTKETTGDFLFLSGEGTDQKERSREKKLGLLALKKSPDRIFMVCPNFFTDTPVSCIKMWVFLRRLQTGSSDFHSSGVKAAYFLTVMTFILYTFHFKEEEKFKKPKEYQ